VWNGLNDSEKREYLVGADIKVHVHREEPRLWAEGDPYRLAGTLPTPVDPSEWENVHEEDVDEFNKRYQAAHELEKRRRDTQGRS
jgi:hypothetical protein